MAQIESLADGNNGGDSEQMSAIMFAAKNICDLLMIVEAEGVECSQQPFSRSTITTRIPQARNLCGFTVLEPYRPPVLYLHQKLLIFSYDLHRAYRQLLQQMGGIDFCLKEYFINCALQKQHWHHQLEKIRTQAKSGKRPLPEYTLSVCNVFNISRYSWVDMITENKLNYHVLGTMESIADTVGMCWDRQQAGFQHQLSLFFRDAARGA